MLTGHANYVLRVAFSPDGKALATGSVDSTIKLWEVTTAKETMTLKGHSGSVNALAFSPDCRFLASAGDDKLVHLWNPKTGQEQSQMKHPQKIDCLAFLPDGRTLATGTSEFLHGGELRLWDIA